MSPPFQDFASIPTEIRIFEGSSSKFKLTFPTTSTVTSSDPSVVHVGDKQQKAEAIAASKAINFNGLSSGTAEVELKFGNIPVKRVKVNVLPDIKVYPGGQSIGVKLNSAGVLVVGHHYIATDDGKVSPGEKATLKVGDLILKIDETELRSLDQIGSIVEKAGEKGSDLNLEVLRGKEKIKIKLTPLFDKKEDKYRLGLYIRNSAAGVGTLTFYHPESGAYGALGHVISDVDTQKPIIVGDGSIVNSSVSSIEKGAKGQPGEKLTHFLDEDKVVGDIKKNTPFGIFGHMNSRLDNEISKKAIPIGLSEDVKKGPAQIYTVVEGQKVEKFDIEVVEIVNQKFPATKGLVIKVTDPVLLEKTGGIVQGMSGSPIIQNGKLIGAVTHVFVNDPTSGYGCFIEWMLQDAGISLQPKGNKSKDKAA
jgi:stage IV sporulation protein B